jgi:hypothetical protein
MAQAIPVTSGPSYLLSGQISVDHTGALRSTGEPISSISSALFKWISAFGTTETIFSPGKSPVVHLRTRLSARCYCWLGRMLTLGVALYTCRGYAGSPQTDSHRL